MTRIIGIVLMSVSATAIVFGIALANHSFALPPRNVGANAFELMWFTIKPGWSFYAIGAAIFFVGLLCVLLKSKSTQD